MKLAIRKEPAYIPGSGFHYMLFPLEMDGPQDMRQYAFELMGHTIVEVPDDRGKQLLESARLALIHQVEIALLADEAEKKKT